MVLKNRFKMSSDFFAKHLLNRPQPFDLQILQVSPPMNSNLPNLLNTFPEQVHPLFKGSRRLHTRSRPPASFVSKGSPQCSPLPAVGQGCSVRQNFSKDHGPPRCQGSGPLGTSLGFPFREQHPSAQAGTSLFWDLFSRLCFLAHRIPSLS